MSPRMYRIGEAAELLDLKAYVLRYWETEFPQLSPVRTDKGQRLYTEEHINLLRRIQQLLHTQGMTIEGARRILEGRTLVDEQSGKIAVLPDPEFMQMLEDDLKAIDRILAEDSEEKL